MIAALPAPYQFERSLFELHNVLVVHTGALREDEQWVVLGVFDVGFQPVNDFTAVLRQNECAVEKRERKRRKKSGVI